MEKEALEKFSYAPASELAMLSIAMSFKRIADAMERSAKALEGVRAVAESIMNDDEEG